MAETKKAKLYFGGQGLLKKAEKKAVPAASEMREEQSSSVPQKPSVSIKPEEKAGKKKLKTRKRAVYKELHEHKSIGNKEPHIAENIIIKHKPEKKKIVRAPTGIPGLDEVIEGGLKKDSVTLIGGCAGSGKSIFAIQFIINGILSFNEPGVYITFEEDKDEFYGDCLRFGWDLAELERQGKFAFIRYTPEQVGKVLKTGGGVIRDIVDKIKAKRMVIDSISAFTLLHKNELEKREACLDLFKILRKWRCTTLVVGQYSAAEEKHESIAVEFEVDGIIWLYNIKKEDIRTRAVEVFKMRGTKHSAKIFPFEITDSGITIYPEQSVF